MKNYQEICAAKANEIKSNKAKDDALKAFNNAIALMEKAGLQVKPAKEKKVKEKAPRITVNTRYNDFAQAHGFNATNPTMKEFGLWLEHGRKAGGNSADYVKGLGAILQGNPAPLTGYKPELAPLWLFWELWRVGLVQCIGKEPTKKDLEAFKGSDHFAAKWAIFS